MYKKFVIAKPNAKEGQARVLYIKLSCQIVLNVDLKDNMGTFNCGKPTGYVKTSNYLQRCRTLN